MSNFENILLTSLNHTQPLNHGWSVLICIAYGLLALIAAYQLSRIITYGHNLKSFHLSFLLLCFLWCSLRSFFLVIRLDFIRWLYFVCIGYHPILSLQRFPWWWCFMVIIYIEIHIKRKSYYSGFLLRMFFYYA
eukprot:UN32594